MSQITEIKSLKIMTKKVEVQYKKKYPDPVTKYDNQPYGWVVSFQTKHELNYSVVLTFDF